jgi:hypothetical protein
VLLAVRKEFLVKRVIVLSSLVTSAVWITVTALAVVLALPSLVEAQVSRVAADSVVVQTAGGSKIHLGLLITQASRDVDAPDGASDSAGIVLLGPPPDNNVRANLQFGGTSSAAPGAGLNINYEDGAQMLRIGTELITSSTPVMNLRDRQGVVRYRATLDADGKPSIQLYDAAGNVIWSAP